MSVSVTPPTSATQRATWTLEATEGTYSAAVTRGAAVVGRGPTPRDDAGRTPWSWELGFAPSEGVGFRYSGAGAPIYTHDEDPAAVLHTLATFVSAWEEAVNYGVPTYGSSENADLFPASCEPFLGAADAFYADTMPEDDDQ
jgi:hypothetical protein